MSPELLPTFPPRPSFYHRISGPSHRHGPSFLLPLLRELGSLPPPASGSPAHSLHRPHPSMLAAEEVLSAPQPLRGLRVFECMSPTPSPPGCLQKPGVLALCCGGRMGGCQPAVAFSNCFLAPSRESVCARQGKSLQILLPARKLERQGRRQGGSRGFFSLLLRLGFYCGRRSIASCSSQFFRYPVVFAAQEEAGGREGGAGWVGEGEFPSLPLPLEGSDCRDPLSRTDSGRHLEGEEERAACAASATWQSRATALTAPVPTFRVADSRLGAG